MNNVSIPNLMEKLFILQGQN